MEEVAVISDAAEPTKFSVLLPPYHGLAMIFENRPLICAFISLWAAQFLKPFTLWLVPQQAATSPRYDVVPSLKRLSCWLALDPALSPAVAHSCIHEPLPCC